MISPDTGYLVIFFCVIDQLLTNDEIHKGKSKRRKVTEISCRTWCRNLFFWLVAAQDKKHWCTDLTLPLAKMSDAEDAVSEPATKRARITPPLTAPLAPPTGLRNDAGDSSVTDLSSPFFLGIAAIRAKLEANQSAKDAVFPTSKKLRHLVDFTLIRFFSGDNDVANAFEKIADVTKELLDALRTDGATAAGLRNAGSVTNALADAHALDCLVYFVEHGNLARPRNAMPIGGLDGFSDQSYLGGLITGAKHLERYAIGRATQGDRLSVSACQALVEALLAKLMEFDFRNGPLRRSYDGVKYTHKRLGDIMYETSLCQDMEYSADMAASGASSSSSSSSSASVLGSPEASGAAVLPLEDIEKVRVDMVAFDEKRELVIKRCRDVQKLSKQSIFSLHRGQMAKARQQLSTAIEKACAISAEFGFTTEPQLRSGSFQNAMEEWVEGRLFEAWLKSGEQSILSAAEMSAELPAPLKITEEEYLGGLVDFTGEIGRWAVLKATSRDRDAVVRALSADLLVEAALIELGTSVPGRMQKKAGALKNNVKKLEHVLYELSLLKGSGRRTLATSKCDSGSGSTGQGEKRL